MIEYLKCSGAQESGLFGEVKMNHNTAKKCEKRRPKFGAKRGFIFHFFHQLNLNINTLITEKKNDSSFN